MRFVGTDSLGNDWSWETKTAPNVLKKERAFSHFDFTLMTRAEIDFLWKLANGYFPYSIKKELIDADYYFNADNLRAFLNWAPLNEELLNQKIPSFDAQVETDVALKPEQFILNWYRENRKGPFKESTAGGLVIGNLDPYIKSGVDLSLSSNHPFYKKIIPPRELVHYIRRKYGIGAAYDQTYNERGSPEFKVYNAQFLFEDNPVVRTAITPVSTEGYRFALNRIKNTLFEDLRDGNDKGMGWFPIEEGGLSLSEQAFLIKSDQWNLCEKFSLTPIKTITGQLTATDKTRRANIAGNLVHKTYNSLNTQKLFAHWRACKLLDELNKWSDMIYRGLESGDIISVVAEIAKDKDKTKVLTDDEYQEYESRLSLQTLIAKSNTNTNRNFSLQFISNIPYDVKQRRKIKDYEYHIRQWNERGGSKTENPLFLSPEYSSDFSDDECGLEKSRYFMRNLVTPKIEKYIVPAYYDENSDKDTAAYLLTLSEFDKRFAKEFPLFQKELSDNEYDVIKNLSKNINANGASIVSSGATEEAKRVAIENYLKSVRFDKATYALKKNITPWIFAALTGFTLAHDVLHQLEHGKVPFLVKLYDNLPPIAKTSLKTLFGSSASSVHVREVAFEKIVVPFKVLSAYAGVTYYNDPASKVALGKEIIMGALSFEAAGMFKTYLRGRTISNVLGIAKLAYGGVIWNLILIGIHLWLDEVVTNIRQEYKQDKFRKLLKEAHDGGYIEGVYAQTAGIVRIKKEDAYGLRVRQEEKLESGAIQQQEKINSSEMINTGSFVESNYIMTNEELMGSKGKRFFWDRIAKNPIECKVLLDIAKKTKDGDRYNPELNKAPTIADYGVFTENNANSIDPRFSLTVGSYNASTRDRYFPYINARALYNFGRIIKPIFKFSRMSIGIDTYLTPFFNGTREPSEFWVKIYEPIAPPLIESKRTQKITDKEKVWLIRKKYGLDLLNNEAGEDCCSAKKPTNQPSLDDNTVSRIKNGTINHKLSSKKFLTGEPRGNQFWVGCEYIVDLASKEVIEKLEEICGQQKTLNKNDKTRGKQVSMLRGTTENTPTVQYTPVMDNIVTNKINVNYLDEVSRAAKTLFEQKGGTLAGTRDILPTDSSQPRFGRKADLAQFGIQTGYISTNAVSAFLAAFAVMDIRSDMRSFINGIATYWATSNTSQPGSSDVIYKGALDTPLTPNIKIETPTGTLPSGRPVDVRNVPETSANSPRIT